MAKKKSPRTRRPKQLALASVHPSALFKQWREAVGLYLKAQHGRSARLARKLQVTKFNVADWFTVKRTDPPGWVVMVLTVEPLEYNLLTVTELTGNATADLATGYNYTDADALSKGKR
jgi:hypothetical protein